MAEQLPKFRAALTAAAPQLPLATYWRYMNGLLPSFGKLLMDNPALAEALAADARALAEGNNNDRNGDLNPEEQDSARSDNAA